MNHTVIIYNNLRKIVNIKIIYKLLKVILWFYFFMSFFQNSFALEEQAQSIYSPFLSQIQTNYTVLDQEYLLKKVRQGLNDYQKEWHSLKKTQIIDDIIALNNEAIYQNWLKQELSQTSQKTLELKERFFLKQQNKDLNHPDYVKQLLNNPNIFFQTTNNKREFVEGESIYQLVYSTYFPVTRSNVNQLSKLSGLIVILDWKYQFIENYSKNKKLAYSELSQDFAAFVTPESKISFDGDFYYGYIFTTLQYYPDTYWIYEKQLSNSGINRESALVYRDDAGKYNFVKNSTKRKLISLDESFWISEKHAFLKYLLSDAKFLSSDIPANMKKIKAFTQTLTSWKSEEESLEIIYDWILNNIEYSTVLDLENMQIFSWSEAFFTKDGVCTAYWKLMAYMMLYSGFYDLEMIEWYVIDAPDFPNIWHAWIRYKDRFYDPTFDDPIGSLATKNRTEYKYFQIPEDIFYANRFHYDVLPDSFLTASRNDIQQYIYEYLVNLIPIYQNQLTDFEIFNPIIFRNRYKIGANTLITPEILALNLWFKTVDGERFRYTYNGTEYSIASFQYYILTSENTETVLSQIGYNLWLTDLYKWVLPDGSFEWRLWYNIKLR